MSTTLWVTSDIHNELEKIAEAAQNPGDAWLDLGDEHDRFLGEKFPFYEHNKVVLSHPSAKAVGELLKAIEELQSEYDKPTEDFLKKLKQLIQNPAAQKHIKSFVDDFVKYAQAERKKLDEKYALFQKPKYRILGNHDPAIASAVLPLINNRVQDIAGINVAGATATGEMTHGAAIVAQLFPNLYAHLQDFTPVEKDEDLEKITADELRTESPAFKALENQQYDVLALHAPILEEFSDNEHDESAVFDAAMAKLVLTAKKKPQIVIWGHDHYPYARLWKRDGIVYAFVGPERQLGLKFGADKKLTSIMIKAYQGSAPLQN